MFLAIYLKSVILKCVQHSPVLFKI